MMMLKTIEEEDEDDEQESNGQVQKYSLNICISRHLWASSLLSAWKLAFSRQEVINNMWLVYSFKKSSLFSRLQK